MDTVDRYEKDDVFGFQRNARKILINLLKICTVFWFFWVGDFLYSYGWKLVPDRDRDTQITFFAGILLPILTSTIVFINIRIRYWNVMFLKNQGYYYLCKKGKQVSKRICAVVNRRVIGKYSFGQYVGVVDEDGKEFILFKGLSRTEGGEVSSNISATIQIPVSL